MSGEEIKDLVIAEAKSKPGYKTTEFWLTVVATAVGFALTSGLIGEGSQVEKLLGMAAQVLSTMGYSVSRGIAKK